MSRYSERGFSVVGLEARKIVGSKETRGRTTRDPEEIVEGKKVKSGRE